MSNYRLPDSHHFSQVSSNRSTKPKTPLKRPSQNSLLSRSQKKRVVSHSRSLPRENLSTRSPFGTIVEEHEAQSAELDELDESYDHVVMAIDMREKGKLGCACYIAREERLLCLEDLMHADDETIETLKIDLQPTIVLQSPRVETFGDVKYGQRRGRGSSLVDYNEETPILPYNIELRPLPEFGYDGALNKLTNLQSLSTNNFTTKFLIPGDVLANEESIPLDEYGHSDGQGKLLRVSAMLDLENKVSIGCIGAIISHLQRRRNSDYLQHDPNANSAYQIRHMEMFAFRQTMLLNADSLVSLQIIQPESHPNSYNQGPGTSGSKESLSLYGLFHHYARTPQGKLRLRQLFLRPSLDLEAINSRLDFVGVFARPDNQITSQRITKSFSKIKSMRSTLTLLHKGIESGNTKQGGFKSGVWASILEFCYHTIDIADALNEVLGADNLPLCAKAIDVLNKFHLQRIGKMVHDVVDLELSVEQHRTVVKRGVDNHLDKLKDGYDSIDKILSKIAVEIRNLVQLEPTVNLNVVYFPQLGFMITLPLRKGTKESIYDGRELGWQRHFTSENQAYFKNDKMCEMDQDFGDLWAMICDIEIELAYDLAQKVLEDEQLLVAASDLCGELDSLLALALGAAQYQLNRPRIVDHNVIDIKAGRHLLQQMTVPSYVPNDTYLVGGSGPDESSNLSSSSEHDGPSMMLLTGPNYSGKSVYQRQVALIVYLAQIGSYVPAESAVIGITDKILTRITTRETVSKTQSAFMIDLQQIAHSLNSCTRRSLIIIDEFGKGTDTCDGAGLAAGVFSHLLSLGAKSPKVLGATHFHEIFESGIFDNRKQLALAHMEVYIDGNDENELSNQPSNVTYLYNLRKGLSTLSYGTQCGAMNGVPPQVVERAVELAKLALRGEDLVAACSALSLQETEDLEDAESVAREFMEQDLDEIPAVELMAFLNNSLN